MLSRKETKKFYDRFGAKQDWQSFYESAAIKALVENGDFERAKSVFEFGCGTGAFAKELLENHLSRECSYLGFDLSETMVRLTAERIQEFGSRASVELSDGSTELPFPDRSFDRFVSNYVLEILTDIEIAEVFAEASRVLSPGGLFCATSLACGERLVSRGMTKLWESIYRRQPNLVGGCRPVSLIEFVDEVDWKVNHHSKVSSFGITSEVLVCRKN